MSEEEDRHTLSIQLANQIINMANNRLQEGMNPIDIAAGMRHAAANFSAFAVANSDTPQDVDPALFAEEFLQIYAYYLDRHSKPVEVQTGLEALINQVKDEN
jgi:hypothetical protein